MIDINPELVKQEVANGASKGLISVEETHAASFAERYKIELPHQYTSFEVLVAATGDKVTVKAGNYRSAVPRKDEYKVQADSGASLEKASFRDANSWQEAVKAGFDRLKSSKKPGEDLQYHIYPQR